MLKLYPKLAWQNLRNNYRVTVPYLLSGAGMVVMFYMIGSITIGCSQAEFFGARSAGAMMELGSVIVAIFSAIFLFYTNSFLMKRRKKELGLYNILGMEKRHIAGVILTETLITAVICLVLGLGLGVAFSKMFFLILEKFIGGLSPIPFVIPPAVFVYTFILFGAIFLLTACYNILQVRLSKPIELLHGGEMGEKEPKAHWLLAILGIGLLGAGYYLAVSIQEPMEALAMFFVAVILVIFGTYLVFITGITAMLKLLKKNKSFYYQTRHFTTISGMLYRMKQNAAGLASICILFTCLLVTVSTTFSLYTGIDDMVKVRYPRDLDLSFSHTAAGELDSVKEALSRLCKEQGVEMENIVDRRFWQIAGSRVDNTFHINYGLASNTYASFEVYSLEEYNRFSGENRALDAGEVLLYDPEGLFEGDTIGIFGKEYQVTEIDMPGGKAIDTSYLMGYQGYALVVNDPALTEGDQLLFPVDGEGQTYATAENLYQFDIAGHNREDICAIYDRFIEWLMEAKDSWESYKNGDGLTWSARNALESREEVTSLYGGVFFLGLFMGAVFLTGTTLIIYYKQVSEGYEDANRFGIMQKVGMSHQEVKKSIHSQVLMVFFLPLVTALLHLCFAFPMLHKILALMSMINFHLILFSVIGCVLVFGLVYLLIYLRTARTYYKIVEAASGFSPKSRGGRWK